MANTSYYDLYKALKADGAVQGDWNSFHKFVGAQGKQGYLNRKKLYDALKADGAVQAKTYEEFNNTLFRGGQASLQAARQRNQQANARTQAHARNNYGANNGASGGDTATQQPQTAAQMALQRFTPSATQQVQKPQRGQQPRGKVSPFVRELYEQQDLENGANDADYTSPNALKNKVVIRKLAKDAAMNAAANRIVNQEKWRREQPIVNTGSPEADQYIVKSQGQQEDEIAQSGKNFVDKNLGSYIDQAVNQEFQDAHKRGLQAEGNDYFQHGTGGADWYVGERKYQQQMDPNAMIKSLSAKLTSFTQNPEFIKQVEREAATLGVSPEDYVKSSVLPNLIEKASGRLMNEDVMRRMPKGTMEYITGGILNSMTGALLTGLTTSRQQRQNQQQADAMTEEGKNPNYHPGTLAKAARGTMAFVADAPAFGVAGKVGAKVAGRVLGAGVEQAAKIANMSKWQRMGYMAAQGGLSGGVTGFTYGATNSAVQNYSTGEDTSLGNTMKLALKGGLSEAASFAVMSGMGGAVGGAGYNIGINGTERTMGGIAKNYFQKVGYEAVKTAMEGVGMWTGGNVARLIEGENTNWSLASGLESAASAAMFKLLHAKDLAMGRKKQSNESVAEYMKNRVYSLFVSDAAKNGGYAFTTDEKNQLFGYGYQNGMADSRGDILRWAKQAKDNDPKTAASYYDGIMKDPNVSWDTKAKFSAMVMGIVPTARPMADHITFTTEKVGDQTQGFKKYINEYAADGTLLSKHSYETKDERDKIMFRQAAFNEEAKLNNAYALAIGKDGDNRLTQSMFLMSKGYDTSLPETEPKNQSLILGMRDKNSELYQEFREYCIENGIVGRALGEVMDSTGLSFEELSKAFGKEPYKRTDKEQQAMTLFRKTLSGYIFDSSKPHPEQSGEDGKDVVADNNLGTEQPNGEAVVTELRNLHQAEEEMEQMMKDNDVFSDNFKNLQQQGMTHPQIYDWMIQNGLTEEQLAPYAHYMNQVAKVQGMQRATAQAIEENANNYAQDWSYHGTLNGVISINFGGGSDKVLYVDYNGKEYLVGSGDVSFGEPDQYMRRRGKEDVGDMLVCLDTETGEMAYLPAKDVYYSRESTPEELKETRKQQLQQINSVPYNQAAQEQAAAEAAKPKTEEKPVENAGQKETATDGNQMQQPQQNDKDYRDRIADLGIMSIDDSPVGMITNNPKNGKSGALTKVQETLIEKKVGSVLDNPNSTISNLHDAIVFEMNTGDRSSANATTLDAIYKVFTAFKEGKLSKDDVLNFVKEQFYGESNNPLRVALEAKRNGETVILNDGKGGTDNMGNVLNSDGSIHTEKVNSLEEIKDEEFDNNPTRSVELPQIPSNVANAIGTGGKPVIIKKNIFKKNYNNHLELDAADSRAILQEALYNPNLVGQTQPIKRPSYKVAIKTGDKNSIVVLDVYDDKKQVEIVGWRRINEKGLAKMKRQAEREGGQFLILSPKDGSAAALSALPYGLSSGGKDTNNSSNGNGINTTLTFKDGSAVPVDANGEPNFAKMSPEQGAELYKESFNDPDAQVARDVKAAEKALKDARKMQPSGKTFNEKRQSQQVINETIKAAEEQLNTVRGIQKALTAEKVAATVGNTDGGSAEGANQAGSVAAEKFKNAPRMVGNKRTRTLPDGTKIHGHYEIVPAESLTPSHDAENGYKKSEGFPVDENGRTVNDRDYEHDKAAQQSTDQMALKYNGQAIDAVPTVSDEGIVYDGNGRTMAGQKAAKEGTDGEYINDLLDNAENFGFTREQIEQSGIDHPRLVMVTDERLPYDSATFAKFNRNEKKTQSNTEQAVAKSKTLSADEVGAIVADIEGNGSLDAFFNNPKAINDLVRTLVSKGVIGQNEVAELMEGTDRLSAQGKEMVKNILLGSIFKPETIRMLGVDSAIKNKAIAGIRAVMDNLKLGDYALRDEIDSAIQLLYEARQGGNRVDTLLRTPEMFDKSAAERYPSISQMMALALEGKVSDFRDLLNEYNKQAAARNTGEADVFGDVPTKDELIRDFLDYKKWVDYETRGNSEREGGNDAEGVRETEPEAQGRNGAEQQADRLAEVETDSENKIDDYIAEHYPHHNGVRARTKEEQAAYDAETEAMKNDETLKQMRKDADEAFDNAASSELADRITETDEESEVEGEHGTTYRKTYLLDDKKVVKVDEPNENGEYTGSYYEYDGKKFGDLKEVADYIDGKAADEKIQILPKEEDNSPVDDTDPIGAMVKAADDFKKDHPMTEEEIMAVDGLDDEAKYTAIDYLNGEDDSEIARICYEQAYNKRGVKRTTESGENIPQSGEKHTTTEEKHTTSTTNPMETIEKAAAEYNDAKPKTIAEKKAAAKKLKEESDKKTQELMNQFLAAKNDKKNGGGKMLSTIIPVPSKALKWMDRNLTLTDRQKEILPNLLAAIKNSMYARIKEGIYNLEDVIENVRKDFKGFFDALDKDDANKILAEAAYKGRFTDPETGERIRLADAAERERKLSDEHQKNLVGDSKDAEDRKQKEQKFINKIQLAITLNKWKSGITGLRKVAEDCGLEGIKDTDIQELVETAVVTRARDIASSNAISDEIKFKRIMRLYENQPSLNQRDSERIAKQQYSTPAPYAFLADMYVKSNGKVINSALEPSAGNGMLTIGLPKDKVHVNDIDEARLMNLHRQGFKEVTSQDGTQPFADKDVDVVVTNPPFGSATPKEYDGYRISSLEGQMTVNALESMKDDGRAAIIIGGKTEYAKNGSLNPKDKAFLGYLYSHYNVEDVINVDGSLYAKQGTSYPTRIILINGRRLDENSFPPVKDKARAETVKDYDELYKRISDDILRGSRMDSSIGDRAGEAKPEPDRQGAKDSDAKGVRPDGGRGSKPEPKVVSAGVSEESSISRTNDELADERGTERAAEGDLFGGSAGADGTGAEPSQSEGRTAETNRGNRGQQSEPRGTGRNDAQPSADGTSDTRSGGRLAVNQKKETKRELSSEKVTYAPKSGNPFTLQSVMPADQQEAVNKNLAKLGDADQFLVDELGYNDKDDLYKHLAAEQVDSVALAIHQAKQGNAFIIGDMTGIGKGRQAASLIRYAKKQGQVPVYFTKTAGLLSDVYRDLVDIGSPDLKPFVFGSSKEAAITDSEGNVKFALPTKNEVKRVLDYIEKNGKLPKEYDYVLTTYSQVGNGIYEYGEDGSRKEKKLAKGKSFGSAAFSGQRRRDAIEKLMGNGYLIMDESHTAGGDSGQGNYFQHIIQKAKNVTFFSATFAKRPDNMPIYALRTAMNQGELKASDLIDAVKRGGATLQEIMSQTLTQCGQMIRRERDMTGVTIDWKAIDDPEKVEEQRAQYDSIIGLFNDIINFQKTYVTDYVDKQNEELAAVQASMGIKKGTAALGIKNVPFASKAFNTVQQVLLSLKAKSATERAVEYLKQGMKPVIALNNTNESQTGNIALGEEMDAPDLGTSLKKGLEGTLRFTQKDAKDNSESGTIKLSDLGPDAEAAYHELEKKIEQTSTGLSLSPIDVIKNELEKAGYKVGELTGRQTEFVYNENGTVTKVKRTDTDKKKLAREFNDGQIDALILNKSAATGISLHASSKFKDQRKRVMIVAQQQLDVNDEVQMRGRIDRTGQILRGAYEYVVSLIPAEQRLLMMFKAKLKSLDANTTSSQKSKFNEMEVADITNKYGDKVVREYMAEHLDLYSRMADPFNWESTYGEDLSSIDPQKLVTTRGGKVTGEAGSDASKLLGRMALLKVAEQEKMLQEIGDLYAAEINRLNEMGENDLEITELPLKAKTIGKEVWKKGTEPDGDNAFADNTYIEKVNMAILKKPMKAQEVQKAQEGLTGGRAWDEYRDEKKADVKRYFDEKVAEATQKNEERAVKLATKAKEKYLKDAKRGQKDSGMTDEQIEKMAGYQYENIYNEEKAKLEAVVKNLQTKAEAFDRVLDTFNTEDAFVLPTDMNNPNEVSGFGNSYGRLIDIKLTDNFSPNASTVSFATLDGRRKITFPISGKVGSGDSRADVISAIDRMTRQASGLGDKHLRVLSMDTANWDKLVSNESRKDGYIITGNLMQALIDTKAQGVGGQLVKYTTEDGEVKTGILMPDRFKPNDVAVEAPISSVEEKFHKRLDQGGIENVKSSDGDVEIIQKYNHYDNDFEYQIRVPKSQKRGGKYFMDKELLSMMSGRNFETRGNSMLGEFKEKDLRPVLTRLSNLGVKIREERAGSEDEGTHFREERGVQYSKTDKKDVKNSRIIPEDVDKSVSSQIEKKFDAEVYRIMGGDIPADEMKKLNEMTQLYAYKQSFDSWKFDENGNKTELKEGLDSVISSLTKELNHYRYKYGISDNESIWELVRDIKSRETNTEGNSGGRIRANSFRVRISEMGKGDLSARKEALDILSKYANIALRKAAAERAKSYLEERVIKLATDYGLRDNEWLSKENVDKLFNDYNSDPTLKKLYDRISGELEKLNTLYWANTDQKYNRLGYYDHSQNYIKINADLLSASGSTRQELASTILHEMLHPLTSDIIAMYQEGHTDKLTKNQIDAAKDVVDIYNQLKSLYKKKGWTEPYALTNPREMITELATPEWRAELQKIEEGRSIWRKIYDCVRKMLGLDPSKPTLSDLDKALDNLLNNFGKEQFDFATQHTKELFGREQNKLVEDKDELDRLEKDRTFRMYSTLQEVDGQYASPMAGYDGETKKDMKLTNVVEPSKWYAADELDMNTISEEQWRKIDELNKSDKAGDITLIPKKLRYHKGSKNGDGSLQFWLQKTPSSGLWANYNPYNHTSTSMMNDQFTGAYGRSVDGNNLVTVEWDIPESEKTSGYQAEMAHDPEGFRPWHSGVVNSLLPEDRQRGVMLSRHRRMNRAVPMEEVAKNIAAQMKGSGLAIPWNTMPKQLLEEVAKQGVPITTVAAGSVKPKYREAFEQQMAEIKEKYPQARFVDVEMTQSAFKEWGKNGGTHFREDGAGVNGDAPVVAKHIDKIAKQVGGKVKMVSSVDEITDRAARRAIEEGRNITGWYDEKTGEVHLYMPNIHDRYTAEKTIWHEVVGHKGMRELIGDENYGKFLRGLWYDLDRPENARLKELVNEELRYNPLDFENGIEEGIARLVEDGKGEPGFWNAIKNKVTDLLHEVGYRIAPNTKDVKYLLWLAKNVQKNPNDLTWKMRADAVRYKLEKENVPAMIEKDGVFYTNDGKARSFNDLTKKDFEEATDGMIHFRTTPSAATALDRYHNELDKHGYMFTESYMDNMLSLKSLMQAIEPDVKNIADIKSSENPYILQNTMQGAMSNAAQMFERNVMKPLDKAMAGVLDAFDGKKDEDKIKNFNLYMITKHGLERNRILFVRDAMRDMMMDEKQKQNVEQLEQDWWDELEVLKEQLDKGQIDLKGYFGKVDDFIRYRVDDSFKADEHDYSGIHAIQGVEHDADPYNDAEAIASVMDSEASMESVKAGSVKDFWSKVKAATQYSLDCDYKNGLMSRDLYGHVSRMFEWYVPLRKYDEQTAEDTYGYITEKGDPKNFIGRTIMRARGRKSLSETNVLAQIGAMGNRAINNGGQNAIKQAFARFIRSHANNNLVTETSVWYVEDPTTKTVTERYPDIPEDATPDEINTIVEDFNREMRDLQSKGLASKVRRRGTIGYRFQKAENRSQHLVDVMIAGKKHTFVINGNPRAAQALNGLLENSGAKGIMKPLGSISRMMAQLCTSYNPEFVMRNIMRDAEFASSNVTAKEGARYGGIWAKYYAQLGLYKGASSIGVKDFAGTTGLGLFAKYRNGTLDMNDKVQRYFKEFMENGGETGWVQIKNMKEWEKQYKQDVKAERSKVQKGGKMVRDFFFGNLENLNEVAENIARFATYCASRDYGRSVVRSTYDAKEVSTNFNRHGSGDAIKSFKNGEMNTGKAVERWGYGFTSSYLRHCSMFFNAGIQSTNLLVKNLKTNPVGTSVNMLSIPFALGALGALLNNALIASEDEKDRKGVKDPYGELPDYIRRNNLCIYKGGGEFITIPLAIELRAFYGLGDLAAGLTFSPNVSGQKNPLFDAVGSMSQLVPVMDYLGNSSAGKDPIGETIKAISPSAISPFVEWEMNSDWKGSPIERRGDWNENSPAWQRAYNGTPEFLKTVNKKANAMTNDVAEGNEDMLGNGFLDMVTNPSMLNHFFGGIGGGAATFGERLLGAIKNGKETETKDVPFVRSLLYTPSEQTSLQRTKSKWYNYKDELETTMANVDRLKAKNVPLDKRMTNLADYYHFQNSSDAAKVRVIELAEKQMKQWKKMRDRASDTESVNFANQNIDRIMMEAVEELDRME